MPRVGHRCQWPAPGSSALTKRRAATSPYNGGMPIEHDDATVAVIAHGLLGTATAIVFAVKLLRQHPDLPGDRREALLATLDEQADRLAVGLRELVRTGGRR